MPAISRCIHTIPNGYYLQWELLDEVYRKAFMFAKYNGNPKRALKAAIAERDWLDDHRDLIYAKLGPVLVKAGKAERAGRGQYKPIRTKRKAETEAEPAPPTEQVAGERESNIATLARRVKQARIEKQKRGEAKSK